MKSLLSVILFSVLLSSAGSAQTSKFGHIDFQQLILSMPERETADNSLKKLGADLQAELTKLQKELGDKSKEYLAQQQNLTDAIRSIKEDEVNSLNQRVQSFPGKAQENINKEETRLLQPIYEKARKAISDVGKEQGLLYVFEVNSVLYHSDQSIDILALVKSKIGVK